MAKGDVVVFNEAKQNIANGTLNLSSVTDFKCMLITSLPTASDATPDSSDFTEVSGTGYTAGGIALSTTWTQSGNKVVFDSSVDPVWSQNAAGPTNIKAALIYSTTAVGEDALCFIDLTNDGGTTPISLQDGEIKITFNANGIFDLT
jgi:hypothetical protein